MVTLPLQGIPRLGSFAAPRCFSLDENMLGWLRQKLLVLVYGRGRDSAELARRLGRPSLRVTRHSAQIAKTGSDNEPISLKYRWHRIPKRSGGTRLLHAPNPALKKVHRQLLRRVFGKLKVHPAAHGFQRGRSIVTHARMHVGQAVVVRVDIENFFPRTRGERLFRYFRRIGWNRNASSLLLRLCTKRLGGSVGLPQGAPTSPILSNLVNYGMDARLTGLARKSNARYSRYADDIIFSFPTDDRRFIRGVIRRVRRILNESGYRMHGRSKLRILRRHQRQTVTGLVVNDKVQLPRKTRRWLRSVEHHLKTGRQASLNRDQLQGWRALEHMIAKQRESTETENVASSR